MSDDEIGTISSIPKHIEEFLQSRQILLVIYLPDQQVGFDITRFPDEPISASVDVVENQESDKRLREFLARYGWEVPARTATPGVFISRVARFRVSPNLPVPLEHDAFGRNRNRGLSRAVGCDRGNSVAFSPL
jgi:hypothetical protein